MFRPRDNLTVDDIVSLCAEHGWAGHLSVDQLREALGEIMPTTYYSFDDFALLARELAVEIAGRSDLPEGKMMGDLLCDIGRALFRKALLRQDAFMMCLYLDPEFQDMLRRFSEMTPEDRAALSAAR